jgi:hypothetical protein
MQLLEFKQVYGHCNVYSGFPGLGRWVSNRKQQGIRDVQPLRNLFLVISDLCHIRPLSKVKDQRSMMKNIGCISDPAEVGMYKKRMALTQAGFVFDEKLRCTKSVWHSSPKQVSFSIRRMP